jgi:SAM-dependent methyltransferase
MAEANTRMWATADVVRAYERNDVRPAEAVLLIRHAERLDGRVLELGCGAGRLTQYLAARGGEVLGIDVSPRMVEACRRRFPALEFEVGDLADLSGFADGSRDVVVGAYNVLGVLDHEARQRALVDIRRILSPGGLLLFSAHNLAYLPNVPTPLGVVTRSRDPLRLVWNLARLPARHRNHRRLAAGESRAVDHAVVNDQAHDFRLLHYYIGRDAQERQLADAGFRLLECLDGAGAAVPPGAAAEGHAELHYAALASA